MTRALFPGVCAGPAPEVGVQGSTGSRHFLWFLRRLGLPKGMEKKGGGEAGKPPGAWQQPPAFALGLGRTQALLPHSLGALKEGWELPLFWGLSCAHTHPLLVIGLWVVPVP